MTNPFREAPLMLACPRCGETLNDVTGDVSMCAHCGGIWMAQPAITTAFQDPTWPHGVSMWWRREIVCPVCAAQGTDETMASVYVDDLLLDRCNDHGLWFDRGELARLVGGTPGKELEHLKSLLETAKTPDWVARREAERIALVEESARIAEQARVNREAAAKAAFDADERKKRQEAERADLTKQREELHQQIETVVGRLTKARETIASDEVLLREMRARLRTVQNQLAAMDL